MCKIKIEDITEAQWKKIYDAIDDMIFEEFPNSKLLECINTCPLYGSFIAGCSDFCEDKYAIDIELKIAKAKAAIEINEDLRRTNIYIEFECIGAKIYDYDDCSYDPLPQLFCDKITVNLKPIIYGS